MKIEVFDPPMCCSTGVCGPTVDPVLPQFAANLEWLKAKGIAVDRFNLAQEPGAFAGNEVVKTALQAEGNACLPLILLDGRVIGQGIYPDRMTLAKWLGIEADTDEIPAGPAGKMLRVLPVSSNCC